ncbi:MAG: type II secretion system protein [Clostridia bacterium]|nr:type II secretion system protein [Clostridia bacterium]
MYKRISRNKLGFTLVELIVVILIMAILAAGATVSFVSVLKNNRIKAEKAELETAFSTCQTFMVEVNGSFSTITNPTITHFASRVTMSRAVVDVGSVTSPPNYLSPEGVYIKCIKDANNKYIVPEIWYVINERVWSITSTRVQYTDENGTKTM